LALAGPTPVETPEGGVGARARVPEGLVALGPAVRAVVRCLLGGEASPADIDDSASEVFRRAIEGLHAGRLAAGAPLRPWVLGIARNVSADARRARTRARARAAESPIALESLVDGRPGADHALELAERARRIRAALDQLPTDRRRAVLLHAEGFGYREIGERLSRPLGTVCTWIARARRDLARALDAEHEAEGERDLDEGNP
jgi:RNA polymerase sigma-70 factor (ECF subfamily)